MQMKCSILFKNMGSRVRPSGTNYCSASYSCQALDNMPALPKPPFSHLKNGNKNYSTDLIGFVKIK